MSLRNKTQHLRKDSIGEEIDMLFVASPASPILQQLHPNHR